MTSIPQTKNIETVVELNKPYFNLNEPIEGIVRLTTHEPLQVDEIILKKIGNYSVKHNGSDLNNIKIDESMNLLSASKNLEKGIYSYPFILTALEGKVVDISEYFQSHELTGAIFFEIQLVVSGSNLSGSAQIICSVKVPVPQSRVPLEVSKVIPINRFCCINAGEASFFASINKQAFEYGEHIIVNASVDNSKGQVDVNFKPTFFKTWKFADGRLSRAKVDIEPLNYSLIKAGEKMDLSFTFKNTDKSSYTRNNIKAEFFLIEFGLYTFLGTSVTISEPVILYNGPNKYELKSK